MYYIKEGVMKSKTKDRLFYIVVVSLLIAVAIGCFAYIITDINNFNREGDLEQMF